MTEAPCRSCGKPTRHRHLHDCAHGIPQTHMAGSERYECTQCGATTFAFDKAEGFRFVLD